MPQSVKDVLPAQKRLLIAGALLVIIFVILFGIVTVRKIIASPDIPFLFSEQGAEWIRFREPIELKARYHNKLVSIFRTRFNVNEVPVKAILNFRSMKCSTIWLDNKLIYRHNNETCLNTWKHAFHVELIPSLSRGPHELRIEVINQSGYPALIAYCKSLKLYTGEDWKGSIDGKTWTNAV